MFFIIFYFCGKYIVRKLKTSTFLFCHIGHILLLWIQTVINFLLLCNRNKIITVRNSQTHRKTNRLHPTWSLTSKIVLETDVFIYKQQSLGIIITLYLKIWSKRNNDLVQCYGTSGWSANISEIYRCPDFALEGSVFFQRFIALFVERVIFLSSRITYLNLGTSLSILSYNHIVVTKDISTTKILYLWWFQSDFSSSLLLSEVI